MIRLFVYVDKEQNYRCLLADIQWNYFWLAEVNQVSACT